MKIVQLLSEMWARNVEIKIDNGKISINKPQEIVNSDVLNEIDKHKARLLRMYQGNSGSLTFSPLSHGQKAMWLVHQTAAQSASYNIPYALRIGSLVDIPVLRSALQAIVDRHPSLRTTLPSIEGLPIQCIHGHQEVCFKEVDTSSPWTEDGLKEQVLEAFNSSFDLENGPVFRAHLFTCSPQDHVLLLTVHHTVGDLSSLWMIVDELLALYEAKMHKQEGPAVCDNGYSLFVKWEGELLQGPDGERLWKYWEDRLSGELPLLNLPTDYPRSLTESYKRGIYHFSIDEELTQHIKEIAGAEKTSLYTTLLSAFFVLLHRYTGQEDILIGSPTGLRSRSEFKATAGYLVSPVVLRADLTGDLPFLNFLRQTARSVSAALKHNAFPFPLIVERLKPVRTPGRSPIIDVIFALQGAGEYKKSSHLGISTLIKPVNLTHLKLEPFDGVFQSLEFDLFFEIMEVDGSLSCSIKYSKGLFHKNSIARMATHFISLMKGIAADPNNDISRLPLMITDGERLEGQNQAIDTPFPDDDFCSTILSKELRQLLVEWNDTQEEYPQYKCIHQLFDEQADRNPHHIAVTFHDLKLTYAELNKKANQLARFLKKSGVGLESVVGIIMERSPEMIITILGILKAGGAYLPIDPKYPLQRIEYIFDDSRIAFLLTKKGLQGNKEIFERFKGKIIKIDDSRIDLEDVQNLEIINSPTDPVYVIYTSGSTGKPKGVIVKHAGLVNYAVWGVKRYVRGETGVLSFPLFTPLSFDLTVTSVFIPLISGNRIAVYEDDDIKGDPVIRRIIKENTVDVIKLTPAHLAIVRELDLRGSKIKRMIIGGEDLKTDLAKTIHEAFHGDIEIYNEYGPTEATVGCMIHRFDPGKDILSSVPIGKPAANVKLYILDKYQKPLPIGVSGELYISGDGVASGYLNRPDLNAACFIPSPFVPGQRLYRTGDLARWRSDGVMEYLGRSDRQVKIRGHRIELSDVESHLTQNESINQCVVEVRQDDISQTVKPESYCAECGLPSNYPYAGLDENGVCSICKDFNAYKDRAMVYFKTLTDLEDLFHKTENDGNSEYDCLMLYSGGKDSTYVLYQLVKEMKLKVLAYTFDNGYIAESAKENINRVVTDLGVDLLTGQSPHMNDIYLDSLKHFSNVCNGCFKTIYIQSMNLCHKKGIPYIVTGLSRGQLFETRLADLHKAGIFDPDKIDETVLASRKMYHGLDDLISRKLEVDIFRDDSLFDRIRFVDFYRYSDVTVDDIFDYLKKNVPWIKPSAGGCSTNCIVNDAGIYVHEKERGYHNYAVPNSWEVRLGHKTRDIAVAELDEAVGEHAAKKILREIGYKVNESPRQTEKYLVAYYTSDERISAKQFRKYLLKRVPDFMVPSFFVRLTDIPLTSNGKVDRRALPAPERRVQHLEQDYSQPVTDKEKQITAIWEEFLHLERIGTRDNFFELGGQSLIATQILSRISDIFLVDLPLSTFIKNPTVGDQAELIEMICQTTQFKVDTFSEGRETGVI